MASEFELIARYFTRPARRAVLGVGDDAALIEVAPGRQLAVSTDTLVAGTHFFLEAEPGPLGHKCLAVNLSDLAAMGAHPRYALLALTLPAADESWLAEFSDGFLRLAESFDVELIGGDTTRGPLSITVTVLGETQPGKALTRAGARAGDQVWVSGVLGDAALAVLHLKGDLRLKGPDLEHCLRRLHRPTPRIALGEALVGIATAAIDVSDGLIADLGHICERSGVGAEVDYAAVPCAPQVNGLKNVPAVRAALLAGGDDYELVFTAPASAQREIVAISGRTGVAASCIGRIVDGSDVRVVDAGGRPIELAQRGFDHFR
ncbi:MAG TPA: thiamine-phosphate kinase [Burkholderiales bacterium]|jgi:thiamine-monophosphate kinase|nr:thiamine-phosphate kinase [Burkholderiales bacterium]